MLKEETRIDRYGYVRGVYEQYGGSIFGHKTRNYRISPLRNRICKIWAKKRSNACAISQSTNRVPHSRAEIYSDFVGVKAEWVFSQLQGCEMDRSTRPRKGGYDFLVDYMWLKLRVNVKGTDFFDPHLLVNKDQIHSDVDIYFLISVQGDLSRTFGWVFTDEIIRPELLTDRFESINYVLHNTDLRPPEG